MIVTPCPTPPVTSWIGAACTYCAWNALPDIGEMSFMFAMLLAITSTQVP